MTNVINKTPYLRTSRSFPEEINQLTVELSRSYIDIANAVNNRVIGIFSLNVPSITGSSWFLTSARQQTLRQVFKFTSAGPIVHNINNFDGIDFVDAYGMFTDGTLWYPLPYVVVAGSVTSQVGFTIDKTNINILAGGTAPTIKRGTIVLEWLSPV